MFNLFSSSVVGGLSLILFSLNTIFGVAFLFYFCLYKINYPSKG